MQGIDKKQQLAINLLIAFVGVITATIGVMAYRDNRKHQLVQQDIFKQDAQIKELELALKQDEAKRKGVI